MGTTGWIILGIIVLGVVYLIFLYNRLVALRQTVNQSWSDISVQLKQRHDLVPNLVEAMFTGFPGNSGETVRISVAPEKKRG